MGPAHHFRKIRSPWTRFSERPRNEQGSGLPRFAPPAQRTQLIEKVWIPGDRKDYYRAVDDIFGQAFLNYSRSMMQNRQIAEKPYLDATRSSGDPAMDYLHERMLEMQRFYTMMGTFNHDFIAQWREKRFAGEGAC